MERNGVQLDEQRYPSYTSQLAAIDAAVTRLKADMESLAPAIDACRASMQLETYNRTTINKVHTTQRALVGAIRALNVTMLQVKDAVGSPHEEINFIIRDVCACVRDTDVNLAEQYNETFLEEPHLRDLQLYEPINDVAPNIELARR